MQEPEPGISKTTFSYPNFKPPDYKNTYLGESLYYSPEWLMTSHFSTVHEEDDGDPVLTQAIYKKIVITSPTDLKDNTIYKLDSFPPDLVPHPPPPVFGTGWTICGVFIGKFIDPKEMQNYNTKVRYQFIPDFS